LAAAGTGKAVAGIEDRLAAGEGAEFAGVKTMERKVAQDIIERQRKLLAEFREPKFAYFAERFGREPPPSLRQLYELNEGLHCGVLGRDCGGSFPLTVRWFFPMNMQTIDYCVRYDFKLFAFANDDDGETLLLSFEPGCPIFIEWDDEPPEAVGLSFDVFVDAVLAQPPKERTILSEAEYKYPRYPTRAAIDSLASRFGLPNDPQMQDWEYEVADAARIDEFLRALEGDDLTDDERLTLGEMVMQCLENLARDGVDLASNDRWSRFVRLLRARPTLHIHTIYYWATPDSSDENSWRVSGLVRPLWAEFQDRIT
jgi:hypothetical protein